MAIVQSAKASGTSTTISATLTSNPTPGNTLVAVFNASNGGGYAVNPPSGWTTRVPKSIVGATDANDLYVFDVTVTAGMSKTVSFTTAGAMRWALAVVEVNAGTFDTAGTFTATSGTTVALPGVSTGGAGTVLAVVGYEAIGTGVTSWDDGFTGGIDVQAAHSPTNGAGVSVGYLVETGAASTGTVTANYTATNSIAIGGLQLSYVTAPVPPTTATVPNFPASRVPILRAATR